MKVWLQFIKYKLSLAVTITGITAYLMWSGSADINLAFLAIGIFALAAGSGALNQYQERIYDSKMKRTLNRPLPSGRLNPSSALLISISLIVLGSIALFYIRPLAAILGLVNVVLYNLVYTKLKPVSYLAILPGALVGAIPPIIGWFAAGASEIRTEIIFLSLLMFMWQIPHFWILIIRYHEEYTAAGFKSILKLMNEEQVRRIVFFWIILSSLLAISFHFFGIDPGRVISFIIIIACPLFIVRFYHILYYKDQIIKAFVISNIFISVFFILIALGVIIN